MPQAQAAASGYDTAAIGACPTSRVGPRRGRSAMWITNACVLKTNASIAASSPPAAAAATYTRWQLTAYFLRLGALGFGGPVALVGYMHRDLVERLQWISESDYKEG